MTKTDIDKKIIPLLEQYEQLMNDSGIKFIPFDDLIFSHEIGNIIVFFNYSISDPEAVIIKNNKNEVIDGFYHVTRNKYKFNEKPINELVKHYTDLTD